MEYTEHNRGKIQNRERARQIIDFSGLRYKNITPTDIDGCIEYKDKAVVFMELKYRDAEMPAGQKLAFERIADDIQNAGKDCALLLCKHNVHDARCDIYASETIVVAVYWHGQWRQITDGRTLGEQVEKYLLWIDENPLR